MGNNDTTLSVAYRGALKSVRGDHILNVKSLELCDYL